MNRLRLVIGLVVTTTCGCNFLFPPPATKIPKYATYSRVNPLRAKSQQGQEPVGEQLPLPAAK